MIFAGLLAAAMAVRCGLALALHAGPPRWKGLGDEVQPSKHSPEHFLRLREAELNMTEQQLEAENLDFLHRIVYAEISSPGADIALATKAAATGAGASAGSVATAGAGASAGSVATAGSGSSGTLKPKLVVGISSVINQPEMWKTHRDTWMKQEGVCSYRDFQEPACKTFPVFVFGNLSDAAGLASVREFDPLDRFTVVLRDVPEPKVLRSAYAEDGDGSQGRAARSAGMFGNMQLKTPSWFRYASHNFGWATHVAKMDLDTYPHLHMIQSDLLRAPQRGLYYGHGIGNQVTPTCQPFTGPFYLISADLLGCWLESDLAGKTGDWRKKAEDKLFGHTLFSAQKAGLCPRGTALQCMNVKGAGRFEHPV